MLPSIVSLNNGLLFLCFRMGTTKEGQITKRDVFEMAGVIPTKWLDNLFDVVNKNSFENLQKFVDVLFCEGFSGSQLINQVKSRLNGLFFTPINF